MTDKELDDLSKENLEREPNGPSEQSSIDDTINSLSMDIYDDVNPACIKRTRLGENGVIEGVLTRNCLRALLRKNLIAFPTISKDEINDKSKGDALSKTIASLQLAWFIAQIVARAVQGLAVTELELTTAALAGINGTMYLFWWSKPLDVRCPVIIQTKGVQDLLRSTDKDVKWEFSRSRFSLRKHIWCSSTAFLLNVVTSTDEHIRSSLQRLGELVFAIGKGICGAFCRVVMLLGGLKRILSQFQTSSGEKSRDNHAVSRMQLPRALL